MAADPACAAPLVLEALRRLGLPVVGPEAVAAALEGGAPGEDVVDALVRAGRLAPHQALAVRSFLAAQATACACGRPVLRDATCPDCAAGARVARTPAHDEAVHDEAVRGEAGAREGARLGPLVLLERLGRGAAGEVFRARHAELGRTCAVKLLRGAAGPLARRRFAQEVEALARLRHPGVVRVFAAHEAGDVVACEMELVEGEDLQARLDRGGPLPWREAARLVADLALAAHHAHAAGVLHRDLKPSNVMLRAEDGRPVLVDFGCSLLSDRSTSLTAAGALVGTPLCMAPEALREGPRTVATEVYALGAVLHAALTGRPPFEPRSLPELVRAAEAGACPPTAAPGAPAALEAVRARAMSPDPAARHPSALALARDLEAVLAGRAPRARARRFTRRRARRLAGGVAVAGVALALGALAVVRRGDAEAGSQAAPAPDPATALARARALRDAGAWDADRWDALARACEEAAGDPGQAARALLLRGVVALRHRLDPAAAAADLARAAAVRPRSPPEALARDLARIYLATEDGATFDGAVLAEAPGGGLQDGAGPGPAPADGPRVGGSTSPFDDAGPDGATALEALDALARAAPPEAREDALAALAWAARARLERGAAAPGDRAGLEALLVAQGGLAGPGARYDLLADQAVLLAAAGLDEDARAANAAAAARWPDGPDLELAKAHLAAARGDAAAVEAALARAREAAGEAARARSLGWHAAAARARLAGAGEDRRRDRSIGQLAVRAASHVVLAPEDRAVEVVIVAPPGTRWSVSVGGSLADVDLFARRLDAPDARVLAAASPSPDEALVLEADAREERTYQVLLARPEPTADADVATVRVELAPRVDLLPWRSPLADVWLGEVARWRAAFLARGRGDLDHALALVADADAERGARVRARWLVDARRWTDALAELERVPDCAEARHLQALARWGLGRREEALTAWAALEREAPLLLAPRLARLEALLEARRLREAAHAVDALEVPGVEPELVELMPLLRALCSEASDAEVEIEAQANVAGASALAARLAAEELLRRRRPWRALAGLEVARRRFDGTSTALALLALRCRVEGGEPGARDALVRWLARPLSPRTRALVREALAAPPRAP